MLAPDLKTPLPGPKAQALIARDARTVSPSYTRPYPLVMARGEGAVVEDVDGNRFLDFMAGIAVASTGHSHPRVVKAIHEAADRFLHICGSDFYYEGMAALCERLCARGWEVELVERHAAPAQEASGNHAGTFHPVATPDDNLMARLTRTCCASCTRPSARSATTRRDSPTTRRSRR